MIYLFGTVIDWLVNGVWSVHIFLLIQTNREYFFTVESNIKTLMIDSVYYKHSFLPYNTFIYDLKS